MQKKPKQIIKPPKTTYPRQPAEDILYDKMAVFDLKEMKFVSEKSKLVEINCDEGIGHAPIVELVD